MGVYEGNQKHLESIRAAVLQESGLPCLGIHARSTAYFQSSLAVASPFWLHYGQASRRRMPMSTLGNSSTLGTPALTGLDSETSCVRGTM